MKFSVSILYAVLLSAPMAMAQGDLASQVVPQVMGRNPEESRPWRAPVFSGQESFLGYHDEAFAIPKGMEKQVQLFHKYLDMNATAPAPAATVNRSKGDFI